MQTPSFNLPPGREVAFPGELATSESTEGNPEEEGVWFQGFYGRRFVSFAELASLGLTEQVRHQLGDKGVIFVVCANRIAKRQSGEG